MAVQWQPMQIPFGAGLSQKSDARASNPPNLDRAVDVQFDELGGLQTRKPFATLGVNIFGGGTLSNIRRIVPDGDELLCFTDTALYSWNAQLSVWVLKSTYLAVKVDETARFSTTDDQYDCDRAELNGTVVYAWYTGTYVYVAAMDKVTGSVLMAPQQLSNSSRPRLVATSTRIMLFVAVTATPALICWAIDPASPATALGGAFTIVLTGAAFSSTGYYDVCRRLTTDTCFVVAARGTTTSYSVATVTSTLTVSSQAKARTADGPVACASDPTGSYMEVIRANGLTIVGDQLSSVLSDTFTNTNLYTASAGRAFTHIACAYRSVTNGGFYRCYAFAAVTNGGATLAGVTSNWVDTGNNVGVAGATSTTSVYIPPLGSRAQPGDMGLGSRAFDYNGSVFVNLMFGGYSTVSSTARITLQNTCFLYRDDGTLFAKNTPGVAGGFYDATGTNFTATKSWLPCVTLTSGSTVFSWCTPRRRALNFGAQNQGYGARSPTDVTITFDSNDARRCVRLGDTVYCTGGELVQYDGAGLYEVGFHLYPWKIDSTLTAAGSVPAGHYSYKTTYRWDNARGERERSTTATYLDANVVGPPGSAKPSMTVRFTPCSHKFSSVAVEVWRTQISPPVGAPFYLATSVDPSVSVSTDNGYILNGVDAVGSSTWNDNETDAVLSLNETNSENDDVLEDLAPTAASIIAASNDRIFLAGIPGSPYTIRYSKNRSAGYVAAFHDSLTVDIPPDHGPITALAFQEETLVAFTATSIYAIPGTGFDNLGKGTNYGPPRIISTDCGCTNAESVARSPMGLIFKSNKGWYLLSGWSPQFIGGPVDNYDSETIVAIHVMEAQHQIRAVSSSRVLVYDYIANQWAEWSITGAVSACIWRGTYAYATSSAIYTEQSTYSALTYGMDVETPWIKLNDLQGAGKVRRVMPLGEYRSAHTLRIRLARDYQTGALTEATAKTVSMSAPVTTTTSPWDAVITGPSGEAGNTYVFAIYFQTVAVPSTIDVSDGGIYHNSGSPAASTFNVTGVRVNMGTTPLTIADLETAINGGSGNVQVTTTDLAQTKVLSGNANGSVTFIQLSGGCESTGATYFQDTLWTATPAVAGGPLQVRIGPRIQQAQSFKVRITAVALTTTTLFGVSCVTQSAPTGEALKLSGLGLEVGIKPGLHRRLPAAQEV